MEDQRLLEETLRALLAKRDPTSSICPSEVARAVGGSDWRPLMQPVRDVARRLADEGSLQVTQGGRVVDPGAARGPIRLRLPAD